MKFLRQPLLVALAAATILIFAPPSQADVLTLVDGTVVEGQYAGGTLKTIRMKVGSELRNFPVDDVFALEINPLQLSAPTVEPAQINPQPVTTSDPEPTPAPEPKPAPVPEPEPELEIVAVEPAAPAPTPEPEPVATPPVEAAAVQPTEPVAPPDPVVTAGTRMVLRLSQDLVARRDTEGHRFYLELENALTSSNAVVIARGSTVVGVVKETTKTDFVIHATDVLAGDLLVPMRTNETTLVGLKTGGSRGGSGIGGIAGSAGGFAGGGGDPLSAGSSVIGSAGSLGGGSKSYYIVPAGTLIELNLASDLRL